MGTGKLRYHCVSYQLSLLFCISNSIAAGSEAWSNGSVRASGAEGSEFEPTFCHSLLSGGPWQDLVSSVRLEPLTVVYLAKNYGVTNQ